MSDVRVTADRLMPDPGAIGRLHERLPADCDPASAAMAQAEGWGERYPLRRRLWIIAGLAAGGWVTLWLGGLVLLQVVGLR